MDAPKIYEVLYRHFFLTLDSHREIFGPLLDSLLTDIDGPVVIIIAIVVFVATSIVGVIVIAISGSVGFVVLLLPFAFLVLTFGQGTSGIIQFGIRRVLQYEGRQSMTHIQLRSMTTSSVIYNGKKK